MKSNVIKIKFGGLSNIKALSNLTQYDKGQIIEFDDVPDGVEVQFAALGSQYTINKIIQDGRVNIPDILLKTAGNFVAWLEVITNNSETTVKSITFTVEPKTMPADYIQPEDEPTFREEMQQIMNATKRVAESVRTDADEGKFDGKDGVSPSASVKQLSDGAKITITDEGGTSEATVLNGSDYVITEADYDEIADITEGRIRPIIDGKMEFYKLDTHVSGTAVTFYHDGELLDYEAISEKYFDNKYFLYAECLNLTFIPCFPPTETDQAIEFISTYIYGGSVMVDRLIINSNNEGKFEEKYIAEKSDIPAPYDDAVNNPGVMTP